MFHLSVSSSLSFLAMRVSKPFKTCVMSFMLLTVTHYIVLTCTTNLRHSVTCIVLGYREFAVYVIYSTVSLIPPVYRGIT